MEKELKVAAYNGNEAEVRKILKEYPGINVNWGDPDESDYTALHSACENGHDRIVSLLLAHPDIDVNKKTDGGSTPFLWACCNGETSCVRLLLKDPRVKVNETNNPRCTPVCLAAEYGYLDTVKWLIASGREIDLGEPGDWNTDAIGQARKKSRTEVVSLLERFKEDPDQTRHEVRVELGFFDDLAAEVFALVVFLSDGLLEIKGNRGENEQAKRFFRIVKELPLELQMIMCRRAVGSMGMNITGWDSEVAFKALARALAH
jgi:ankyrin repeat protein